MATIIRIFQFSVLCAETDITFLYIVVQPSRLVSGD